MFSVSTLVINTLFAYFSSSVELVPRELWFSVYKDVTVKVGIILHTQRLDHLVSVVSFVQAELFMFINID